MKLRAHEYCACIGFSDNKAVVNKRAARQYKSYDVTRFLSEGLYKQAFSLAYYRKDQEQMEQVLAALRQQLGQGAAEQAPQFEPQSVADLVRLFGNIPAPTHLSGVLYV